METKENTFKELSRIDVSEFIQKKQGLDYLSWAHAWKILKEKYPDASYKIMMHGVEKDKPYSYDENTGYMVFTEVTVNSLTLPCHLPVLDHKHKAMKNNPYTYVVKEWSETARKKVPVEKSVESANMADINRAIMRCLAKNIALHGLGISLYAEEDLTNNSNGGYNPVTKQQQTNSNPAIEKKCEKCGSPLLRSKFADKEKGDYYYCSSYKKNGCKYRYYVDEAYNQPEKKEKKAAAPVNLPDENDYDYDDGFSPWDKALT